MSDDNDLWGLNLDDVAKIDLPWRSFWYLATPYTDYPQGLAVAAARAEAIAGALMLRGVPVFSPIAHGHAISRTARVPNDAELWAELNAPFVRSAYGCLVAMIPGFAQSHGIRMELLDFHAVGKPVVHMVVGP